MIQVATPDTRSWVTAKAVIPTLATNLRTFTSSQRSIMDPAKFTSFQLSAVAVAISVVSLSIGISARQSVSALQAGC